MSSAVDALFNAKEKIASNKALFAIKQHYVFHKNTLHIFVEADDDFEFYRKSIEFIYVGFDVRHYPQKGKKNVLDSYDVLDWNLYNKSRILFFVDKDYEDILKISSKKDRNIFVTKFYSIENYLSSQDIFEYTLKEIFKIKEDTVNKSLLQKFDQSFKVFENKMIYLTAVILIYRKENVYMDLSALKMEDFFTFNGLDIFPLKYRCPQVFQNIKVSDCTPIEKVVIRDFKVIESIKKTGADISKIDYKIVRKNIIELKKYKDSKIFIRGKYHLWFFIKCLTNVHQMSAKINVEIQKLNLNLPEDKKINKINTSIVLNESNIFDILPMKLKANPDVNLFLLHNKHQING